MQMFAKSVLRNDKFKRRWRLDSFIAQELCFVHHTLDDINGRLERQAGAAGHEITCRQSNAEHELVDAIHEAGARGVRAIVINPGAFTHTSVAIRDALLGIDVPFYEVHLSNVHGREAFRHQSYLADVAVGVIAGLGAQGYEFALAAAMGAVEG